MATEKELELLDNYLANRMNASERTSFEQKLTADPTLRSELNFQQSLIDGIKKERAAELKSMLNNIPVTAGETGETTWLAKAITGCVVAGLIGTGLYFFLEQKKEEKNQLTVTKENKIPLQEQKQDTQAIEAEHANPVPVPESQAMKMEEKTSLKSTKKKTDSSRSTVEKIAEKRNLEVFDPTHDMEDNTDQNNSEVESNATTTGSTIVVETDNTNKKYTFNYQFKNGKLFLYGAFEKNLYEILEFFDESKRTVFLYYKDNYYLLDEDSQKVKLLTPITDPVLLKKLKEHRGS